MKKDFLSGVKRKRRIRSKINCEQFNFEDFLSVSPYTSEQLNSSSRQPELIAWRHVGMTWLVLQGYGVKKAGALFGRSHCAVIHAMEQVENALSGFGFQRIKNIINLIESVAPKEVAKIEVPIEDVEQFVKKYRGESPYSDWVIGEIHKLMIGETK